MPRPIIELSHISKSFGKKVVLSDLSFTVYEKEMIAIQGVSGSGKSTLLNIMGLLESGSSGTYSLFNEVNVKPDSSKARKLIRHQISYLFQNFALVDNSTVEKNLLMALHYSKRTLKEKRLAMEKALTLVDMEGFLGSKVFELSGGEQQRVALARCMVKPGSLLLADEPTGSLDENNRDNILALLKRINEAGKTIVMVTHDNKAAAACDRSLLLEKPRTHSRDKSSV